jgi:hypothetical protein
MIWHLYIVCGWYRFGHADASCRRPPRALVLWLGHRGGRNRSPRVYRRLPTLLDRYPQRLAFERGAPTIAGMVTTTTCTRKRFHPPVASGPRCHHAGVCRRPSPFSFNRPEGRRGEDASNYVSQRDHCPRTGWTAEFLFHRLAAASSETRHPGSIVSP